MGFIKNTIEFFKPNDFEGDNYGWLTNQLSHILASNVICVVIFFICEWFTLPSKLIVALPVALFWIIWEARHYYLTKNKQDLIEDLFFELSGVLLFVTIWWYIPIIGVTILFYLKRIK